MVKKYVKKPVVVEAVEFTGTDENVDALNDFVDWDIKFFFDIWVDEKKVVYAIINTPEGEMKASLGDYIIKGIEGEYYPCKPDIFKKTYDLV